MNRALILLALLLAAWGAAVALAGRHARAGLAELRGLRAHRALLEARAEAGTTPMMRWPAAVTRHEGDRAAAIAALTAELRAAARGIAVDGVAAAPVVGDPVLIRLALRAHGDGDALLRFVARIEAARPGVRFAGFTLSRDEAEGGVRLDGTLLALWQPR
ncbi:hypothetical protein [Sphingomonas flavalba]|uniref:hypothetical protein n=1 Tax=Sphingomonas flavalba TaxID=2559804 RepID=UPI00109DCF63|nr:hypothetical protein [Sphingomonas flavalba]